MWTRTRRRAVRATGERRKLAFDQVDDLRIQLDGVDRPRAVVEPLQHVGPRPGAEHQNARCREQVIGRGGREVIEVGERLAPAVVASKRARPIAVDEERELRRRLRGRGEAQAGRVAERYARALDHAEEAQRARALGEHPGPVHLQRLTQLLVLGEPQPDPVGGQQHRQRDRRAHERRAERSGAQTATKRGNSGRRDAQRAHERQRVGGGNSEERGKDGEATGAGPEDVIAVDARSVLAEPGERQADRDGGAEERDEQQSVDGGEPQRFGADSIAFRAD